MQIRAICKLPLHRHNQSLTEVKLAYAWYAFAQPTTQEANEAILDKHAGFPRAEYNYSTSFVNTVKTRIGVVNTGYVPHS